MSERGCFQRDNRAQLALKANGRKFLALGRVMGLFDQSVRLAVSADPEAALRKAGDCSWGLLFWVPLMIGRGELALAERWVKLVLERIENRRDRGSLGRVALVFASIHPDRLPVWRQALMGFDMTDTALINEWKEEIVQESRHEAKLEERRENLIQILDYRFPGFVSSEVLETIRKQESLEVLASWFSKSISVFSAKDMLAAMRR